MYRLEGLVRGIGLRVWHMVERRLCAVASVSASFSASSSASFSASSSAHG